MALKWFDLTDRSVLLDEETKEVVGQAVPSGLNWLAYDNARDKHDGISARSLGRFTFLQQAKTAVEQLVVLSEPRQQWSG